MERKFEQELTENGELLGLPEDLFTDPGKYDEQIPLWQRTVGFVKQYEKSKPKGKDALLDQLAAFAIKDAANLSQVLDNLSLVAQVRSDLDIGELTEGFAKYLERSASRRSNLSSWSPRRIGELVGLGLDISEEHEAIVERVKAALFNAPRTVEEAVDLFYNAAFAMVETSEPDIREELFAIMCREKAWLNPASESVTYLELGMFSIDDLHLGRYFAFLDAWEETGKLIEMDSFPTDSLDVSPYSFKSRRIAASEQKDYQFMQDAQHRQRTHTITDGVIKRNPLRFRKIVETIESNDVEKDIPQASDDIPFWVAGYLKLQEYRTRPWPENIMKDPDDPLRKLMHEQTDYLIYKSFWEQQKIRFLREGYQQASSRPIQLSDAFIVDIMARNCHTLEQKAAIIREVCADFTSKTISNFELGRRTDILTPSQLEEATRVFIGGFYTFGENENIVFAVLRATPDEVIGRLCSVLEYHRPLFGQEQTRAITTQNKNLRMELQKGFVRSVGKRGYTVVVSDPLLKQMGYEMITFNQEASSKLQVKIVVDHEEYSFTLDRDYRIVPGEDIEKFVSPQDQAWLELLTLSHLKSLLCTEADESKLKTELVGGARQYERYRKQLGRRECLRWQIPGKNFSTRAFELCLKSNFPAFKNLYLINKMKAEIGKGGTLETGIWTYQSGSEYVDTPEAKPVKVAFKNASEDIRRVIPLGEVSEEELARVEQEILRELERS